jgi:hypothetical protein
MLVKERAEIAMVGDPERIWDVLNDPAVWMASNPEEHFGTEFLTPYRKAQTGALFRQRESVAGFRADMKGHFLVVDRPRSVSWTGIAHYRLLGGLITYRVPQSGIVRLERGKGGLVASHEMFIDFPDSWFGKLVGWYFTSVRDGAQRLREHGQKELAYFKGVVEGGSGVDSAARH